MGFHIDHACFPRHVPTAFHLNHVWFLRAFFCLSTHCDNIHMIWCFPFSNLFAGLWPRSHNHICKSMRFRAYQMSSLQCRFYQWAVAAHICVLNQNFPNVSYSPVSISYHIGSLRPCSHFHVRADYIFFQLEAHHFGIPIACMPTLFRDSL